MTDNIKKKLLFTLRHAPYGNSLAKEALDAILATSAYEQDLSVIFMDDGVFQLMPQQQTDAIKQKNFINMLSAFPIYEIDALFVCEQSLHDRGITLASIPNNITVLDMQATVQLLKRQDHLLSF
jgi:tRNA 2-thiouridine synthesizing protein C